MDSNTGYANRAILLQGAVRLRKSTYKWTFKYCSKTMYIVLK